MLRNIIQLQIDGKLLLHDDYKHVEGFKHGLSQVKSFPVKRRRAINAKSYSVQHVSYQTAEVTVADVTNVSKNLSSSLSHVIENYILLRVSKCLLTCTHFTSYAFLR
jgi:hypothetical protein